MLVISYIKYDEQNQTNNTQCDKYPEKIIDSYKEKEQSIKLLSIDQKDTCSRDFMLPIWDE